MLIAKWVKIYSLVPLYDLGCLGYLIIIVCSADRGTKRILNDFSPHCSTLVVEINPLNCMNVVWMLAHQLIIDRNMLTTWINSTKIGFFKNENISRFLKFCSMTLILNVEKILAVINATYAAAKRKPEKIRLAGIRYVALITARIVSTFISSFRSSNIWISSIQNLTLILLLSLVKDLDCLPYLPVVSFVFGHSITNVNRIPFLTYTVRLMID